MPDTDNESIRIRPQDHERLKQLADKFDSTRVGIVTAMRIHFDHASDHTKKLAVNRAKKLFPGYRNRTGRGNRRISTV